MSRPPDPLLRQFARFAGAGAVVTALSTAVYTLASARLSLPPMAAATLGYAVSVGVGFRLHAAWTFGRTARACDAPRYLLGSLSGLALNAGWAWLLGDVAAAPLWAQVAPMAAVTPILSFAVNRRWVFRDAPRSASAPLPDRPARSRPACAPRP